MSAATITDLRDDLDAAGDAFAFAVARQERVYTALRRFEQAEQALEDAIWRQAVESHRSVQEWAEDRRWGDYEWWWIWRGVIALRWGLNQRRGPVHGFQPSKELALRV